jgi:hypothetical protein
MPYPKHGPGPNGEPYSSRLDPDDVSAQIDLIGLPWLMIGEEPSAAPNERRISHTASKPTVTPRHVVRSPLGRPRPSLPEAFSSIWPYGQVVTSYLRKGHL